MTDTLDANVDQVPNEESLNMFEIRSALGICEGTLLDPLNADEPFYLRFAHHWVEKVTFDLELNTDDYPTIHWVIARSMLDKATEFVRHKLLATYMINVKNNFQHAVDYLHKRGIMTYRVIGEGKKHIRYITIDPNYRNAKKEDFERRTGKALNSIKSYDKGVAQLHPTDRPAISRHVKAIEDKLKAKKNKPEEE